MLNKAGLLRFLFRKTGLGFRVYMKKAQRERIREKRRVLIRELKLNDMSTEELRSFIKERLCHDKLHPKHNYKFCLCWECNHVDYCAEDPCGVCEGPVTECEPPNDNED